MNTRRSASAEALQQRGVGATRSTRWAAYFVVGAFVLATPTCPTLTKWLQLVRDARVGGAWAR